MKLPCWYILTIIGSLGGVLNSAIRGDATQVILFATLGCLAGQIREGTRSARTDRDILAESVSRN